MRLLATIALVGTLIAGTTARAWACSCMQISPAEALRAASDVFLAVVAKVDDPPMVRSGDGWRNSDKIIHLRLLASWKGVHPDTLSLVTGSGGGDCGVEFIERGVWLVYGHRGKDGQLYASICERTRPIESAREDSIALGKPTFDRLQGRSWTSFGPPATCPIHQGIPIRVGYARAAVGLTPDARRAFPRWVEQDAPWAGMWLAPSDYRGGSVDNAWVCPMCREAAWAWVSSSQEYSTGPEPDWKLPLFDAKAARRSEDGYRQAFPRAQFAIQYGDGRTEYDSIEMQFTRAYGGVRDTSMKFELNKAGLDRLYEATVAARLMDVGAPHPAYPTATAGAVVRTDRSSVLFVRCGIEVRQFRWYMARAPKAPAEDSEWGRLIGVYRVVQRILAECPEMRGLSPLPLALDDPIRDGAKR